MQRSHEQNDSCSNPPQTEINHEPSTQGETVALGQEEKVARRYAKALFDTCEPTQFDTVNEQLAQLAALWKGSVEFCNANLNPQITLSQRADVLSSVVGALGGWKNDALKKTVEILVSMRKAAVIPHLADLFAAYVREFRKNLAIEITSATAVSTDEQQSIKSKLSAALGGEVTLAVKENPDLIGGVTLRLGDRYLDRSIAGTLGRIAGQLAK